MAHTYKAQMEGINIDGNKKEAVIKKRARLRCSLSSLLFNLFIDYTRHDIKDNCRVRIKIKGETIEMPRFAGDIC